MLYENYYNLYKYNQENINVFKIFMTENRNPIDQAMDEIKHEMLKDIIHVSTNMPDQSLDKITNETIHLKN